MGLFFLCNLRRVASSRDCDFGASVSPSTVCAQLPRDRVERYIHFHNIDHLNPRFALTKSYASIRHRFAIPLITLLLASPDALSATTMMSHLIVTDLTVCTFSSTISPSTCELDPRIWHCIKKDLYQYTPQQSAWLYVAKVKEEQLAAEDLVVMDIKVGEPPLTPNSGHLWESRPGGIWVLRSKFSGKIEEIVTEVDVLFGVDAVDPRPQWSLVQSSLRLDGQPKVPGARLSILHGSVKPRPGAQALRVGQDGKFKIVQISDTHMVAGVGVCKDAIDAYGKNLPESEADPRTVDFIGQVLDIEKPDLTVFTGDQLHHDVSDSQTALVKIFAPVIKRSIPFAAVFGNHDSEGIHALSRK